jgi:hypothetical protein
VVIADAELHGRPFVQLQFRSPESLRRYSGHGSFVPSKTFATS